MLKGLNHITLTVNNIDASLDFYTSLLGFTCVARWDSGGYLYLGDLWLCLSLGFAEPSQDYSHLAFDISEQDFLSFKQRLVAAAVPQWQSNQSEGESLYILDPNEHKLEIHVGSLHSRLAALKKKPYKGLVLFGDAK